MQLEQKRIRNLFSDGRTTFALPFYQRPYAWNVEQCIDLWEDLFSFAFPKGNSNNFDIENDEYYLGNIVTYRTNLPSRLDLVDGQQRLITLSLLLRAFYVELHDHKKGGIISECLWLTNENGDIIPNQPRMLLTNDMDTDKDEFTAILSVGHAAKKSTSHYAKNYLFFQKKIAELKQNMPEQLWTFAMRFLENAYVNNIVIDDSEQANSLFLTINDRGTPLTPADIYKGILYRDANERVGETGIASFLKRWNSLALLSKKILKPNKSMLPLEFIFYLYAHRNYVRLKRSTALKMYSCNNNAMLKDPQTLADVEKLADFLSRIAEKKSTLFPSKTIAKKIYTILNFPGEAPWYLFAAYFFKSGMKNNAVSADEFEAFLDRTIAFGVGVALCGQAYSLSKMTRFLAEMPNLISGNVPNDGKFSASLIRSNLNNLKSLTSYDKACKILLYWWTFRREEQELPPPNVQLTVEHIFATKLAEQRDLENPDHINMLGNLALLEKSLNEKAQNFAFSDKIKTYLHGIGGKCTDGTCNTELRTLAQTHNDFTESDILARNQQIIDAVLDLLDRNDRLIK